MTKGTLEIHSENILPIIKRWLYSDHDIFVRELVSNSCDALHKLKILRDQGLAHFADDDLRIRVTVDKEKQTITFDDNGIGMTADEIQRYITQIAFSSAEEFMEKYKSNKEGDQIIGHFGLGFYSSFMVAHSVEIDSLSYQPEAAPAHWRCDGSREYTLDVGDRADRGTAVTLHIADDNKEYLETGRLRDILRHYCSFLPYPIFLGDERINAQNPLWIKPPSECTKEEYLEFYRYLYPMEEEPLFWMHLNVDYPFHLQGILFFPKIRRNFDINKHTVKLYCNRVFVSDNCKDVLPEYLLMLRGVVDSPDIPLNVSRSYLQSDRTVRQLSGHISKKVTDSLMALYRSDKQRFLDIWNDVSPIVKLGILEDEKFYERVKECLLFKNTAGEWTTVADYLERMRDKTQNKVFYTGDADHQSHLVAMYQNQGIEVLSAASPIDTYLIQYLEKKHSADFVRIDAAVGDHLLDKEREKSILDAQGRSQAAIMAELVQGLLDLDNVTVEAKSLSNDALPGLIVIEEQERRMRDYFMRLNDEEGAATRHLLGKKTFVINTNNPLVNSIEGLQRKNPSLAKELVHELYELTLLGQREMDPSALGAFIQRSNSLLQKLTDAALQG